MTQTPLRLDNPTVDHILIGYLHQQSRLQCFTISTEKIATDTGLTPAVIRGGLRRLKRIQMLTTITSKKEGTMIQLQLVS